MCTWGLKEWGDIANIIIAVASVATAIVTAIVLCKQHKLQINTHQPIFRIERIFQTQCVGGTTDTECVKLYNDGVSVKYLSPPSIKTIFKISINGRKKFFEIKGYYSFGSFKINDDKCLVDGYTPQNLMQYQKIYYALRDKNKKGRYAFEKFDLLKLEYIDINNVRHAQYYKNCEPINKFEYQWILRKISNRDRWLSIKNIQSQDILEYFD